MSMSRRSVFVQFRRISTALVLTGACAAALAGCAGTPKNKLEIQRANRPVELIYSTGASRLDDRQWVEAVDYFHEVERQYPYSEWARRAILMTAYAHYQGNDYEDARDDADRFISLYPGNPSTAYAYYLKAICYFEQIIDVGRDQAATEQALSSLREVVRRYPTSEYATDAKLKIDMVNDQLAGKEMAVGRFYLKENQPLAAIGRFHTVIDKYQTTLHTPEALYRLVEAYLTLGIDEEAKRNAAVLGYNYPGDIWYQDAYTLMSGKGLRPAIVPIKAKRPGAVRLPRLPFTHGKVLKPPIS
jgi:outer membrane protein assembly factor BamD